MTRRINRFISAMLCLILCVSLCCFMPASASAEFTIPKILAQLSYTPVALMDVGYIQATTTTEGCYIESYAWYQESNGQLIYGQFGTDTVYVQITLRTYDGFVFDDNVAAYLNNNRVAATVYDGGTAATFTRVYAPDVWTPSVVKHPGSEKTEEGGNASFVSTATYTVGYKWFVVAPDGVTVFEAAEVPAYFEGASASGYDTERLNLHHVTPEMDGCRVFCQFSGLGGTMNNSREASLTVKYEPRPSATPEPAPEPTPEPTPEPSATPEPTATPMPTEEPHVHDFAAKWESDESGHWHECSCGQKTDKQSHSMIWTQTKAPSRNEEGAQDGICTVCGYLEVMPIAYEASGFLRYVGFALIAFCILAVIILIIESIKAAQRRRRRRKRRAAKAKARAKARREAERRNNRDFE